MVKVGERVVSLYRLHFKTGASLRLGPGNYLIFLFLRQCSLTGTNFSSHDPSHSNVDYNLGQNKMEEQANRPPKPPPPKFEGEATQYFPILYWGRGGGGINFQSLQSKIFYR